MPYPARPDGSTPPPVPVMPKPTLQARLQAKNIHGTGQARLSEQQTATAPPTPKQPKTGMGSILDAFVNSQNPFISAIRPPGAAAGSEIIQGVGSYLGEQAGNIISGKTFSDITSGAASTAAGGIVGLGTGGKVATGPVRAQIQTNASDIAATTASKATTAATAPILLGMNTAATTFDHLVNRPIGTFALAADPQSPLYNTDQYGQGFQFSDLQVAWNRTEKVTAMQAIVANPALNKVGPLASTEILFNAMGGVEKYDPWDVNSMNDAQSNPYYSFLTGSGDLAIMTIVPPAFRALRIGAMGRVGWTNTIKSAEELQTLRDLYNAHDTMPNAYGDEVHRIAGMNDPALIRKQPEVGNNVGVDKAELSRILAQTSDADTVNEILLANKGDVQAIKNLVDAADDSVWRLAGADDMIRANAANGIPYRPTGDALKKVNGFYDTAEDRVVKQTFNSPLERDAYFADIRDMVTEPTVDGWIPRVNSTWRPATGTMGEGLIGQVSRKVAREVEQSKSNWANTMHAVNSGDYSHAPQWIAKRFDNGDGSPVTARLQWLGSKSPLGHVTRSGARPDEILAEGNAQWDSIPFLRGNRLLNADRAYDGAAIPKVNIVHPDGSIPKDLNAPMTANEWRAMAEPYLTGQPEAALPEAWQKTENAIIKMAADHYGVEHDTALAVAEGFRGQIDSAMQYMRESEGYLWDEQAGRVKVEAATQRQMLSSFQTLPMADVVKAIKEEGSRIDGLHLKGQDLTIHSYDFVQKIFRTSMLFRPGYTGKNSVIEPLLSRYMAHGTILADEGLWASIENSAGNWGNRIDRVRYHIGLNQLFDKSLRTKAMRNKAKNLAQERYNLQQVLDNAQSEADWFGSSAAPPAAAAHTDEVHAILIDAQMRINAIDAELDSTVPAWRQVNEPATQAELRGKLQEFKAIIGENPEFVPMLERQVQDIDAAARARVSSPKEIAQDKVDALTMHLDQLTTHQKFLTEEHMLGQTDTSGWSVATEGKQAAEVPSPGGSTGDIARGRDYQGLAVKRQIESVNKQLEKARTDLAGADDQVTPKYTPNERAQLDNLISTLDRIEAHQQGISTTVSGLSIKDEVAKLQAQYDEIVAAKQSFRPIDHLESIQELEKKLIALDEQITPLNADISVREGRLRAIAAKSGMQGYYGSGSGSMKIPIGGQNYDVPMAFSQQERAYGTGYRAEASAQSTNRLTADPSFRVDYETGRWRRAVGADGITSDSPLYWPQMQYVVNRFFRDERLIMQYMKGATRQDLAKWLDTPVGRAYQKSMGKDYLKRVDNYDRLSTGETLVDENLPAPSDVRNIKGQTRSTAAAGAPPIQDVPRQAVTHGLTAQTTELDTILRLVDQYLPDKSVQKLAAERELSAGELQAAMGGRDDLSRIVGDDLNFHASRRNMVGDAITKVLDKIWQWIATNPEDRLARWPFYQTEFRKQITARAKILGEQGVRLDEAQWNALRQASYRGALKELEKTFYNIRRYSTPVYASRFLMTFPGAFFNSLYRYGRFMVREPERMIQMGAMGNSLTMRLAVDEKGNKVDNIKDAKYFVIPGTQSDPNTQGIRFPIQSIDSLTVGWPSPSIGINETLIMAQRKNVHTTQILKDIMGEGPFSTLFPYGIGTNPLEGFATGYERDLYKWARGGDEPAVAAEINDMYANSMRKWQEGGYQGDKPTIEQATEDVSTFHAVNFWVKWVSAFAVKRDIPGQIIRDGLTEVKNAYPNDVAKQQEVFLAKYGDAARYMMMSDKQRTTYIPPTQEAYDRVWVDFPDLAKKLVKLNPNDPTYVGLMTYGVPPGFAPEINKALSLQPLPGDNQPVNSQMDPVAWETKIAADNGWSQYDVGKAKYDAEHLRLATLRKEATNQFDRQNYSDTINGLDQEWKTWTGKLETANPEWYAARNGKKSGDTSVNAAMYFKAILADPKFADTVGKTDSWVKVQKFLESRDNMQHAYDEASKKEDKDALKSSWNDYVTQWFTQGDPEFTSMYNRYFAKEWE